MSNVNIEYCVILPLRTGKEKEVLGNRVFHCVIDNNNVEILDDNAERRIHNFDLNQVKIVDFLDIYFKDDITMWLK